MRETGHNKRMRLRAPNQPKTLPRAIVQQAGNRCAFPGCKNRSYLELAHIRAVRAGGPRYDPRSPTGPGTANLIVLCPSHHRLVDANPHQYSVEVLQKYRADALAAIEGMADPENPDRLQQSVGLKPSSLREALAVWNSRTGSEPEMFWHQLFEDVPELLAAAVPGDTIQYGSKCYVGGKVVHNVEGNIIDFVYQSRTALGVTLVEIKTPSARLIGNCYRHMFSPSSELAGSVMQVLGYRDTLQKDFYSLTRDPQERVMRVFNPKALVVIGDLEAEDPDEGQRRSFELFRNALSDVIIVTFDQLFGKVCDLVDIINAEASTSSQ